MTFSKLTQTTNSDNFTFQEKLEFTNLFMNLHNKKNLIIPMDINNLELNQIFSNNSKSNINITINKYQISDKIKISSNTKYIFVFVFLKNSDLILDKYFQIITNINLNNNIIDNTRFNNNNFFKTLKKSFVNEGIYIVEVE